MSYLAEKSGFNRNSSRSNEIFREFSEKPPFCVELRLKCSLYFEYFSHGIRRTLGFPAIYVLYADFHAVAVQMRHDVYINAYFVMSLSRSLCHHSCQLRFSAHTRLRFIICIHRFSRATQLCRGPA